MSEIITHSFVSAKSQSADTTLVSKNEWNDGHIFSGGINGQVLLYDNTMPNNMRWTDGAQIYTPSNAVPTPPVNSPANNLNPLAFSSNSAVSITIFVAVSAVTTGAANFLLDVYIDGVAVNLGSVHPSGTTGLVVRGLLRPSGVHTTTINASTVGNVTFTSLNVSLTVRTDGI